MKNKYEIQVRDSLTLSEYEDKYSSKVASKRSTLIFNLVVLLIGVFLFICALIFFKEMYEIHKYLGYGSIGISAILYIALFIAPVVKLKRMRRFEVDVTAYTAKRAKRHNDRIREELANQIVEMYVMTEGSASLYSSKNIETLLDAKKARDKKKLITALNTIYLDDVKPAARDIIKKCSLKSALFSSLSQRDTTDAMIVAAINLQMVKDIVFLFGFRPSDERLVKILSTVLTNSLVAYGVGNVNIGQGVVSTMGGVVKNIPLLGSAISYLIDGSIQGLTNATLTLILGNQTIRYLMKEYNLQNILDSIQLTETDEEFIRDCDEIKEEILKTKKNKTKATTVKVTEGE